MAQYTRDEIFNVLKDILVNDFEIEQDQIVPDANLFEDLDFDSIDAVDLAVRLQEYTNRKISPDNFKEIKTVNDVVIAVEQLLA